MCCRSEEQNPVGKAYGDECPGGSYCPEHSYQPTLCLPGYYQPHTRMTNITACLPCEPGKFCNDTGLDAVAGDCYPGFYCEGGASTPAPLDGVTGNICPAGSYCPKGSHTHLFCPNGTYSNHTGASQCYDCPEGYYCVNRDRAELCPTGYYCPLNTGADLEPCLAGTFNPTPGIRNRTECTPCTGGHFCMSPGLSTPSGMCSEGYYCTTGGSFSCQYAYIKICDA